MKINFTRFRIWTRCFRVVKEVKTKEPSKVQKIIVADESKKPEEPFEMALPFRIYDPDKNLQILEDKKGNWLTKKQSDKMIKQYNLNRF